MASLQLAAVTTKRNATLRQLSDADYRRLAAFRYALRQYLHFSDGAARQVKLTPQQYQALVVIRGFPGGKEPSIGEFANRLLVEHHSAVGLVDRLESAGLAVRRKEESDGRRVTLSLTGKAEALLSSLAAAHRAELRRLMPSMKPLVKELDP